MDWVSLRTLGEYSVSPSHQPFFLPDSPPPPPPPPTQPSDGSGGNLSLDSKISPSILLIIIILAIIFFISGLLHLLVRFLFRPTTRDPDDLDNVTALQGQLQQLFHLHDSGVDQSYIDTLPVFHYKAIIGLKNPFDCAVCLCEFDADDKLRLLPKCSHAFHLECIDTWLLSHSTCPLCRGSLLAEFSPNNNPSPIVLVLESGSESSREIGLDRDAPSNNLGGCHDLGSCSHGSSQKFNEKEEALPNADSSGLEEKVVPVKLGKFMSVEPIEAKEGEGSSGTTNNNVEAVETREARRCFSMGSFEYVMNETPALQVAVKPQVRKQCHKKASLQLAPGHMTAMSECDCNSTRFKGFDGFQNSGSSSISTGNGNGDGRGKRESFSISKIWLRTKKDKDKGLSIGDSSRRVISFRFPLQWSEGSNEFKLKDDHITSRSSSISEMDVSRWENSELGVDEEVGSCVSIDSQASMPWFARRTLQWLWGRQNKVVHSSSNPNV